MIRSFIGRGLVVLAEDDRGINLEGTCRLAPGRQVALYGLLPAPTRPRRAYVITWQVVHTGRSGMVYRGYCEWLVPGYQPMEVSCRRGDDERE